MFYPKAGLPQFAVRAVSAFQREAVLTLDIEDEHWTLCSFLAEGFQAGEITAIRTRKNFGI